MKSETDWRDPSADEEKRGIWKRAAGSAAPMQVWYWSEGFRARDVDHAFLTSLRDVLWDSTKDRVLLNGDVKPVDAQGEDITFVRISMPKSFVPSFAVGGRTFVAMRALTFNGVMAELSGPTQGGGTPLERVRMTNAQTVFRPDELGADVPMPAAIARDFASGPAGKLPVLSLVPNPPAAAPPRVTLATSPFDTPSRPAAAAPSDEPTTEQGATPPAEPGHARPPTVVRRHLRAVPAAAPAAVLPSAAAPPAPTPVASAPPAPARSILDDDLPPAPEPSLLTVLLFAAGIIVIVGAVCYALFVS